MEENGSMSKSNKNGGRETNKAIISHMKAAKDHYCWENSSTGQESFGDGGDLMAEFSWPPRSYTCTFCKREFRSAQALGGHMNVHRREKARLRQITPPPGYLPTSSQYFSSSSKLLDLNLDPNPNPNPNIATRFPPFAYTCFLPFSAPFPFHRLSPSDGADFTTIGSEKSDFTSGGVDDVSHENMNMIFKKSETSVLVESKLDDMDLELRLGCS